MDFTRGYDWEGEEKPAAMVLLKSTVRIRLTDPDKYPLPHARCRLAGEPDTVYDCDEDGIVEIPVADGTRRSLNLEWGPVEAETEDGQPEFPWQGTFQLDVGSARDEACQLRLAHLGFDGGTLQQQVSAYQEHFGMDVTGDLGDIRDQLIDWHDGGDYPDAEPLSKIFDEQPDGALKLKPAVRNLLQKLMNRLKDANGYRLVVANVTFVKKALPNGGLAHTVRDVVEVSPEELGRPVENQVYTLSHELTHVLQFKVSPGADDDEKWEAMIARYQADEKKYGKNMQYFVDNDLQAIRIDDLQVRDERFPMEAIARKVGAEGQASLFDTK